jgi:hypothetical protein
MRSMVVVEQFPRLIQITFGGWPYVVGTGEPNVADVH